MFSLMALLCAVLNSKLDHIEVTKSLESTITVLLLFSTLSRIWSGTGRPGTQSRECTTHVY